MKITVTGLLLCALEVSIVVGGCAYFGNENERINREGVAEMLKIEKGLKKGIVPDQETIDRLYRWRNAVDEKYSFGGPNDEFITVYDRVIKPL